jgi:hypothetical protein
VNYTFDIPTTKISYDGKTWFMYYIYMEGFSCIYKEFVIVYHFEGFTLQNSHWFYVATLVM